jgi:hypothetical protein
MGRAVAYLFHRRHCLGSSHVLDRPAIEKVKKTSAGRILEEHGTLLFFAILLCIVLAQRLWWKSRLRRFGGN